MCCLGCDLPVGRRTPRSGLDQNELYFSPGEALGALVFVREIGELDAGALRIVATHFEDHLVLNLLERGVAGMVRLPVGIVASGVVAASLMYTEALKLHEESQVYAWDFLVYGTILYHPVKYNKHILTSRDYSDAGCSDSAGVPSN